MFAFRRRFIVAGLGFSLIFGSPFVASAGEPKAIKQPVAVDLHRLSLELDFFAAQTSRTRLMTAVTGIGVGCVLVPTGLVLLSRTDGVPQALVVGTIVGGSAQLLSVPLSYLPTRMDDIRKELTERIAANQENRNTVQTIEGDWRDAAKAGRTKRQYVGATLFIAGLVSLTGGLTFLLGPEDLFGMPRRTQYTWGGVMMGTGVSVTTAGIRFLIEWSPEETAWETYRMMKADIPAPKASFRPPSVAVVPTQGGALGFAMFTF